MIHSFLFILPTSPRSTLFPYTTLFRSYKKGFPKDGSGKLFLYGYGAYGIAIPPAFNSNRISLLDRGWACAIAHIRGGDDLDRKSTRLNSSHRCISYAVFCLKKKRKHLL